MDRLDLWIFLFDRQTSAHAHTLDTHTHTHARTHALQNTQVHIGSNLKCMLMLLNSQNLNLTIISSFYAVVFPCVFIFVNTHTHAVFIVVLPMLLWFTAISDSHLTGSAMFLKQKKLPQAQGVIISALFMWELCCMTQAVIHEYYLYTHTHTHTHTHTPLVQTQGRGSKQLSALLKALPSVHPSVSVCACVCARVCVCVCVNFLCWISKNSAFE